MANKVKPEQIVKQLKVCRKTVYNAGKQFQESGKICGKSIPRRTRTVCTKRIILATKKKKSEIREETSEKSRKC